MQNVVTKVETQSSVQLSFLPKILIVFVQIVSMKEKQGTIYLYPCCPDFRNTSLIFQRCFCRSLILSYWVLLWLLWDYIDWEQHSHNYLMHVWCTAFQRRISISSELFRTALYKSTKLSSINHYGTTARSRCFLNLGGKKCLRI